MQLAQERQVALPLPDAPQAMAAGKPAARLVLTRGVSATWPMSRLHDDLALAVLYFDYPQGLTVVGVEPPSLMRQRLEGRVADAAARPGGRGRGMAAGARRRARRLAAQPGNCQRLDGTEDGLMPLRTMTVGWLAFLNEGVPELERQGIPVDVRR
jgi:hypothetical protein